MRISDGAIVPGNARIDGEEISRRIEAYWRPYRRACADLIDQAGVAAHGDELAVDRQRLLEPPAGVQRAR